MNFQKLNITDLHLADYNPRKGLKPADSEYHADMTVIGGHQRVKVL